MKVTNGKVTLEVLGVQERAFLSSGWTEKKAKKSNGKKADEKKSNGKEVSKDED